MKNQMRIATLCMGLLMLCACGKTAQTTPPSIQTVTETQTIHQTEAPDNTAPSSTQVETTAEASEAQTETTVPVSEMQAETTETPAPQTTAEILKLYNSALTQTAQRKAAFKKQRSVESTSYKDTPLLRPLKSYVVDFMGLDETENSTVKQGQEHYERYLQRADLKEADVTAAECVPDGQGGYKVTLHIRPGSSSIDGGADSRIDAPLDRSGIAAGQGDRGEWDHKTAQNAYAAVEGTYAAVRVEESYSDAVLSAEIDASGALQRMHVEFNTFFRISKILGQQGEGTAHTTIEFSDFL